jgi:hypothetical protein
MGIAYDIVWSVEIYNEEQSYHLSRKCGPPTNLPKQHDLLCSGSIHLVTDADVPCFMNKTRTRPPLPTTNGQKSPLMYDGSSSQEPAGYPTTQKLTPSLFKQE